METLIVVTLGLLISVVTISIFVSGLKNIQATKQLARLHSNAIFLSNTLNYWVKRGETINIVDPQTIEINLFDSSQKNNH